MFTVSLRIISNLERIKGEATVFILQSGRSSMGRQQVRESQQKKEK